MVRNDWMGLLQIKALQSFASNQTFENASSRQQILLFFFLTIHDPGLSIPTGRNCQALAAFHMMTSNDKKNLYADALGQAEIGRIQTCLLYYKVW